ncbi:subclass B3 metallo-beta-lactamase [Rheinheimera sp. SA_1]|uniref:subclass B3 metallo-beta-lactamase n=1 Tax=Rheinheimera sp. SA_1 TaxID=1827365 RepID=UPI0009EDAD79|nr:subclass B3 metallo-beta-lactamase [Rheinheimera sp. SA_1]
MNHSNQHSRILQGIAAISLSAAASIGFAGCSALQSKPTTAVAVPTAAATNSAATVCAADAGWNDPATPRNIFGNSWYVGTCGITAILITSDQGHVLIDGATEKGDPLIAANIQALGFKLSDVRTLLISHEHHDHAGGIAYLQQVTGGTVYARAPAAEVLESGNATRLDPQFLELDAMAPVAAVQRIAHGQVLRTGALELTAHATPGHTPGSTSWTWTSCDKGNCQQLAYVDSLTAISDDVYKYSDDQAHPGYLAAFRAGLKYIATLPCDILLTPHPSASNLWPRLDAKQGAATALVNADACRDYAAKASIKLDQRLLKEQSPNQ